MDKISKFLIGLWVVAGLAIAQQPVRVVVGGGMGVILGAPGQPYNSTMTAITTGGTALTANVVKVKVLFCRNDSGSDTTFTVTNAAGTVYFPTNTIGTKEVVMMGGTDSGVSMTGVTITAGANSAVACQVEGAQQ